MIYSGTGPGVGTDRTTDQNAQGIRAGHGLDTPGLSCQLPRETTALGKPENPRASTNGHSTQGKCTPGILEIHRTWSEEKTKKGAHFLTFNLELISNLSTSSKNKNSTRSTCVNTQIHLLLIFSPSAYHLHSLSLYTHYFLPLFCKEVVVSECLRIRIFCFIPTVQ